MLAKRIIPCLDVKDGRVVKGVKFLELRDAGDPPSIAQQYDKERADEVVFLDITASHEKRDIMLDVVKRTSESCFMPLTVGGGVRTNQDVRELLSAGCDKVSMNTSAVKNPDLINEASARFGNQCIVVAMDAKKRNSGWEVYTHGGRIPENIDAVEWAKEVERRGAGEILLTSMDSDGTQDGYDIELTRAVSSAVNIPVIASGGAGTLEHIFEVFDKGGADAALAASIFHFRKYSIQETKEYLQRKGIVVRL